MTTSTATSNGSTDPASAPERISGVTRVRDAQVYHLASLAHDAAFEAERLCNDIYRAASPTPGSATGQRQRRRGA